ncbi:MAG: NUDIX domain-containing protein [Nanoarchaeota archaeon]
MKIHHKIGGIIIQNKKLLVVRKYGEPHFIIPGGKTKAGEKEEETLKRELAEELSVNLISAKKFKTYQAVHFKDKNKLIIMDTYFSEIEGKPEASSEIQEFKWIDSSYKEKGIKLASIDEDYLIPELKKQGLIN